ncbi:tissue factor pathway inhibitor 2-like isoform X1 [Dinothrombium tinctorium]|uniref:Tissue factor pathway inhibitor 2-like isoform X1 n=1 Tax=Dinothrombium tinctorium TaxID=1965070 RepID=A0A443QMU0_9ACAR|nr:tissue factor pathway inhibitor 2-like isoform X1 [Dinothrombium tinctorium]
MWVAAQLSQALWFQQKMKNVCKVQAVTGPCTTYEEKYFFNPLMKRCEKFIYSGCGGSDNNFNTIEECSAVCENKYRSRVLHQPCELDKDEGPCMALQLRFYYNKHSDKCESFTFGGCKGNANRFLTKIECEKKCGKLSSRKSFQKRAQVYLKQLDTGIKKISCTLIPDSGPCLSYTIRFYYDPTKKTCEEFIYGGCKGNANNFLNFNECQKTCAQNVASRSLKTSLHICRMPAETGDCRAYMPKYYFNSLTGICETFIYSGCGGNDNRFDTKLDCEVACGRLREEIKGAERCKDAPMQEGDLEISCYKLSIVWSYNETSNTCEKFHYSGCGGNRNRFKSRELCMKTCVRPTIVNKE